MFTLSETRFSEDFSAGSEIGDWSVNPGDLTERLIQTDIWTTKGHYLWVENNATANSMWNIEQLHSAVAFPRTTKNLSAEYFPPGGISGVRRDLRCWLILADLWAVSIMIRFYLRLSRASSLFRADFGAKSVFLMSACGVKCCVQGLAGSSLHQQLVKLDLTTAEPTTGLFFTC